MFARRASDERPTFLRRVQAVWTMVKTVALNATGVAVFLCILAILYNEVMYPTISISSISVPKDLSEKGYTEEAAAFELRESLVQIIKLAHTQKKVASIDLSANDPSIIVPETGISLDFAADRIRKLLSIGNRWKISGVITTVDGHYALYLSIDNGIDFNTKEISIDDTHINKIFGIAAQDIFEVTDPLILAASLQETDKDKSLELANNIIEEYPKVNPIVEYAYVLRGNIFLTTNKIDLGILEYQNAIALNPKNSVAHMDICAALAAQGAGLMPPFKLDDSKLDKAILECQSAIDLDPTTIGAYSNLALILKSQGKQGEALEKYREAVARNPKNAFVHFYLGSALADQDKLDEAVAELQKAIALDPHRAAFHQNLGNVLQKQHKIDEAKAEIAKADKLLK
jgi:tetratricopeptide (TPR) repeat protein